MIIGTSRNDRLVGTPGPDVICGGPGADLIDGRGGDDRIYGGPGNDRLTGGPGNDWIQGGGGSDHIIAGTGADYIYGDAGPAYQKEPDAAKLTGADVIEAGTGADVVYAGPGNDIVLAGGDGEGKPTGFDIVYGDAGNDIIMSDIRHATFSDQFFGGSGDDLIWPNPIRLSPLGNVVWGGKGNDIIIAVNAVQDGIELDEPKGVKIPVAETGCRVTVPILQDAPIGTKGSLECELPVRARIPGLPSTSEVTATVGTDDKAKIDLSLFSGLAKLKTGDLAKIASGGFASDVCICDPRTPEWPWGDLIFD